MSIRTWPFLLASIVALGACNADADDDGLTNKEEEELGLDPQNADFDGDGLEDGAEAAAGGDPKVADTDLDGLTDGEEVAAGTDPALADTDGDTYRDGDEVIEGKDPLDPESVIYLGGWPYYVGKEDLAQNPVEGATYVLNKQIGRIQATDQFGETLDLYDFYNLDGKPVIVDESAEWCPPCNDLADWLDGDDLLFGASEDEIDPALIQLRKAINQGDAYWVTVIGESDEINPATGGYFPADEATIGRWHDQYPKKQIPVLVDFDYSIASHLDLGFWPTLVTLDGELKAKTSGGDSLEAMCKAAKLLDFETSPEMGWCAE